MKYFLLQFPQRVTTGDGDGQVNIPPLSGDDLLTNILNLFYFIAGLTAVIVIIIAGLAYATSGGDAGRVAKAKNQILFAVIGLVVVLLAFSITNFVIGRF